MHPNRAFRDEDHARDLAELRSRAFGCLTASSPEGPIASHLPFIMPDDATILGHVVRNTPIQKALTEGVDALMIVSFGDSYISPDWYGVADQVPTWNYVAIHIWGHAKLLPADKLPGTLAAQSATLEAPLHPKAPWHADKMTDGVYERMQRAILPFEMKISRIESTWKLNQNKTAEAIAGAATALRIAGFGLNTDWIADQMDDLLKEKELPS